jgi:hypothetical protein
VDVNKFKAKIEEILNNLNHVGISNKIKADVIASELVLQLEKESNYNGPYLVKGSECEN